MKNLNLKKIIYNCIGSLGMSLSITLGAFAENSPKNNVLIAITQIAPHPSLNLIRQGIEDELKEQKIKGDILFEDAQGNITTATQIAAKFVGLKPDIIVPITTPSAQSVYAVANSHDIPIVFAAVNDPVSAKLTPSLSKAGRNITGVSDFPPLADQVGLIQEILPEAKKVGVVYNPSEANSVAVLKRLEQILAENGMTLVLAAATGTINVMTATKSLIEKVDVIYIPNDNTVVAALDSLIKVTLENKIPVFCADPESVKQGCLATVTHSQYDLGRQAGKLAAKVLKGIDIQTLSVEKPAVVELSVNQSVAQALNIALSESIISRAQHIIKL